MNNIVLKRGKVWKLSELPKYSLCLDGACSGPEIDAENHRYSFDHHNNCLRFATDSTCIQVLHAIGLGLSPENFTIYCNDVDADVASSVYLLKHADRIQDPLLKKLIEAIGLGDQYLGALPLNGMHKVVEWVSAPETESKRNGDYNKLSDEGLLTILESILHRIDLYVNGEAGVEISKQQSNHPEYKVLKNESNYVVVESKDPHVFSELYHSGFDRLVVVRPQSDNSNAITLAKRSDFIDSFPLFKIYEELNKLEEGWGGSSTCGGAPRNSDGSRTKLSLDEICSVINNCINGKKMKKKAKKSSKKSE